MSLRLQLLAVGLLTLLLPWLGLRYVEEMEGALRLGLEQALLASAATAAASLAMPTAALCVAPRCADERSGSTIYATPLPMEPELDGVRDPLFGPRPTLTLGVDRPLYAGTFGRFVYLHVGVPDPDLVYQRQPGQPPYGDRVVLALEPAPGNVRWLLLNTSAPGAFRAQETAPDRFEPTESYDARVIGAWLETGEGYALELRVPIALVGYALGVGIIDVDRAGGEYAVSLDATWDAVRGEPGRFIHQRPELQRVVDQLGRDGSRFRVIDGNGWVLAAAGVVAPRTTDPSASGVTGGLFRWLLRRDDPAYPPEEPPGRVATPELRRALQGTPATAWYGGDPEREAIVAAAAPILDATGPRGAVLLEQASDPILTLTNEALARLMTLTLAATTIVALGLLGYATWLSLRVRRLAASAETALGPRGEIRSRMPGEAARDELGALARSFGELLARLRDYTEYLRTLTGKLSHELRTPLAVVTTSLDNLEHEPKNPAAEVYLGRLRQGAQRLDAILAAMSEATELEQAIRGTRTAPFDLAAVVEACCQAYRDVYREREIVCRRETAGATEIVGSGELVAQLLDKLIDNAVGFSAPGSRIDVRLAEEAGHLVLEVTNVGPRLPAAMREQLFDSLVSVRTERDGRPHLGLGLYIVALVAEFHGGHCAAEDLADGTGVTFRVWFPRRRQ
jgi:two-component system sensor histidine kinase ChvG